MQTVRNQTNFVITQQKPKQSLMCRSLSSATSMILKQLTPGSQRHTSLQALLNEFNLNNDTMVFQNIDQESSLMLEEIREWMRNISYAFTQLTTENRCYVKYQNSGLFGYFLDAQDNVSYGEFRDGYLREFMGMRGKFGWTEEFVREWIDKTVQMKETGIDVYRANKKAALSKEQTTQKNTFKRSSPSINKNLSQADTQASQHPTKKIKKDTLNYHAIVKSVLSIIKYSSSDQQRQNAQAQLKSFKSTQDPQYLQLLTKTSLKQMIEIRAYMKSFMEAFIEVTQKIQFKKYDDGEMINRLMRVQETVNPENVLEGYRKLLEQGYFGNGFPQQMISQMVELTMEKKNVQIKTIVEKLQRNKCLNNSQ